MIFNKMFDRMDEKGLKKFFFYGCLIAMILGVCTCCVGSASATNESLYVVYCNDQSTYPFSETSSSNIGITVKDVNNNYYRYYPNLESSDSENAKIALSGNPGSKTWYDVYYLGSDGYIQSSGSEYINTGVVANNALGGTTIEFAGVTSQIPGGGTSGPSYCFIAGARTSNYVGYSMNYVSNNGWQTVDGATYSQISSLTAKTTGSFTGSPSTSTINTNFLLFASALGSDVQILGTSKIYSAKIYKSGTLERDYIPIVYNGIYAMYDNQLSGGVIYGNDGDSGAFTGGGTQARLTYQHQISATPTITAVAVTSTTPAEIGSTVSVTATLSDTPTTDSGTVTFYISTTPAVSSSWTSQGSEQLSGQSAAGVISHSFTGSSTAGTYYVKAILSDTTQSVTYDSYTDGSITNVFFVLQYTDPIPNAPGGPLQPISIPYTITLTASCSNEITVASYVWQLQSGGVWGNVSTGQQYTPTITTPGNHVYRFLAIGKNGNAIPSTSITVNAGYAPSATITSPTTGTQIEPGQQLTLEATIGGTAGTYTWDFGDGVTSHGTETGSVDSSSQSITTYVVYNQQKGTRDITLTVTNVYGTAAVYRIYVENGKGTLRPAATSTVKPVDSSGIYNLINDSKPTSYENQMPNLSAMVTDITAPMTSIIGEWFYLILFAVPYLILFLRQKNILIPSILGVLFAAWLLVFLPGAAMKAAIGILILCVAGGIIGLYVKRQS